MYFLRLNDNRLAQAVSLFFVASLTSAPRIQIGIEKKPVVPSVVHGICTVCNTNSCTNCIKCAAAPCNRNEGIIPPCLLCANKSVFCSPAPDTIEETLKTGNPGCQNLTRCCIGCEAPRTVFIPRSLGADTARELAGWEEFIYQFDVGEFYVTTGHVLGYTHSLYAQRIARSLFGSSVLHFVGSQVENRPRCALLADNFGLSPHFRGSLSMHPTIENIFLDNQFFIGLDPLLSGLYARIHAPLVHTRWNLNLRQKFDKPKKQFPEFPACYMSGQAVPAATDIIQALSGNFKFGDMQEPWKYGRFVCGPQSKTGLADIDLILGYMPCQSDTYHFGVYGQLVAPTGNRFTARTIFEPLLGNTRHWELGIGLTGHLVIWERDADQSLALYAEGNMTHLFKNRQMRSFDFCHNGLLSRFMLLKELVPAGNTYEYGASLINGINFATRPVNVRVAIKGDVSAKLCYRSPCFIVDLGYNFYGITEEHLTFLPCNDERIYGIKGNEGVCALEYATQGVHPPLTFGPLVRKIALNSTENNATIRTPADTDNSESLPLESPTDIAVTALSRQSGIIEGPDVIQAYSSNPPILVTHARLHKESGAMPAQATHKVFGYLGYNLYNCDWCYNPYVGVGGELELDARSCTEHSALNQWSVWIKGGFEF